VTYPYRYRHAPPDKVETEDEARARVKENVASSFLADPARVELRAAGSATELMRRAREAAALQAVEGSTNGHSQLPPKL
jgi:hypothetical protein